MKKPALNRRAVADALRAYAARIESAARQLAHDEECAAAPLRAALRCHRLWDAQRAAEECAAAAEAVAQLALVSWSVAESAERAARDYGGPEALADRIERAAAAANSAIPGAAQ